MTGNKFLLTDYQEFDGRFVAFRGSPKREIHDNVGQAGQEKASDHEYILLPFMPSLSTQSLDDKDVDEVPSKGDEGVSKGSRIDDPERTDSSTQDVNTDGPSINNANTNINTGSVNINVIGSSNPSMPTLEETGIFYDVYDDKEVGVEAATNNLELSTVRRTNHNDYQNYLFACFLSQQEPKKVIQALTDPSWIKAMQEELLQFKLQKVWTMVDLPNGKRAIGTKWVFRNKKDERGVVIRNKARLIVQGSTQEEGIDYDEIFAPVARIEAISQDKYVAYILKKFDFTTVKTASTPMKPNKALIKDTKAKYVDLHLYRSMIGSLMYLTSSRPDLMYAVYDSDYVGASLDKKSTTRGCQFLGKRLISWQCKKQTIVANSTTEAEYVAASSCCEHVLWIQYQMLDYGFNLMNTKIYIDNESTSCIVRIPVFHSKTRCIKIRHHFIRDSYEKKLIQEFRVQTSGRAKISTEGCLDWIETTAKHEVQVSVVGLTYY
nr:putative reverse transcriptase, RNA-dependent DNA polymerase [Tanacetum cinerariifolium]